MKKETKIIPISETAFWEAARLREIAKLEKSEFINKSIFIKIEK